MDLEWFKNYYNPKFQIIKNHGQENYAILIKKCAVKCSVK